MRIPFVGGRVCPRCLRFPRINFVLDSDCIPVTLFKVERLWGLTGGPSFAASSLFRDDELTGPHRRLPAESGACYRATHGNQCRIYRLWIFA